MIRSIVMGFLVSSILNDPRSTMLPAVVWTYLSPVMVTVISGAPVRSSPLAVVRTQVPCASVCTLEAAAAVGFAVCVWARATVVTEAASTSVRRFFIMGIVDVIRGLAVAGP